MTARRLYFYSDLRGVHGWFATLDAFRKATGALWGVRVAHVDIEAPAGFVKSGSLANDAAVAR